MKEQLCEMMGDEDHPGDNGAYKLTMLEDLTSNKQHHHAHKDHTHDIYNPTTQRANEVLEKNQAEQWFVSVVKFDTNRNPHN